MRRGRQKRRVVLEAVDRASVVERLRAGDRVVEIAAAFGVAERTVYLIGDEAALADRRWSHSGFRLTYQERVEIAVRAEHGEGVRAIARALGRSASTVSRELARNGGRERYRSLRAEERAQVCGRRPKEHKLERSSRLRVAVREGFDQQWSPQQISARLRVDHPDDQEMRISHETLYRSVYVQARGELRRDLAGVLRTGRTVRKARGRGELRGRIAGMVPIADRPPEADDRRVPGHWEGDLILGAHGRSQVATLVERTTRFLLLARLEARTTAAVIEALRERIGCLPAELVRSLTWDQGVELSAHARFTSETGINVYFCDPHSPWQRGSNENTNGLLRQYLPKGSDLSVHSQQELDQIAARLNGRPRETLEWLKPAEKMAELLGEQGALPGQP